MSPEEVLRPWLRHGDSCALECMWIEDCYADSGHDDHKSCTCGLAAALASLVPAVPSEGLTEQEWAAVAWLRVEVVHDRPDFPMPTAEARRLLAAFDRLVPSDPPQIEPKGVLSDGD